ncbi:7-cyano-7-deazaguanine synthase [Leifsonia aquatica]|uniref:7-cyano-7-deazaguanine synthase n=1 Tax=Leifsonia aquatica ATCC 14665 TaxID=1358026 RepID=U2TEY1_LEIAQ|nr:ExsB [Leifsonia aquatica ATCC 14665]
MAKLVGDAVVLLSGGVDSAALAAFTRPALALFVDYGQIPARAEARASRAIADRLGVPYRAVRLPLNDFGGGLLLDGVPLDDAPSPEWWPYRNQFLGTAGAAIALQHNLTKVLLGSVRGDGDRHMDGSPQFYRALTTLTSLQEGSVQVEAPALELTTVELVRKARLDSAILALTVSCHRAARPCGDCPGCWKRQQVFAELDVFQPTVTSNA